MNLSQNNSSTLPTALNNLNVPNSHKEIVKLYRKNKTDNHSVGFLNHTKKPSTITKILPAKGSKE
jgi:hypothetical protein